MALDRLKKFEDYIDFISVVLLCSPNRFIYRDYLEEEDQLNLERSFKLLYDKFSLVEARIRNPSVLPEIRALLDASLAGYHAGNEMTGAHRIQEFRNLILKNARRGRN